jgi:hypothetical protein
MTAQRLEKGLKAAAHQAAQGRTVNVHFADAGRPLDLLRWRRADEADFDALSR